MDPWRPWARTHGSGFLWEGGLIVTNSHVVTKSTLVSVHFSDGSSCRARTLARASRCDLALLRPVTDSCSSPSGDFQLPKPLRLAQSSPQLGDEVYAIGHPGTWAWLVGVGSVTGLGRQSSRAVQKWQVLQDFQRHCAVNGMLFASVPAGPGSSGGPLLNRRGEVVGVTTWQFRSTPLVTAAVSAQTLHQVLPQLRSEGHFQERSIGLEGRLGAARLQLPAKTNAEGWESARVASGYGCLLLPMPALLAFDGWMKSWP
ncbi:unnamed protein product [Effrenium voratum]|nr:unnamed protein product [Effrenium voratum]